jgi:hypothetical protein
MQATVTAAVRWAVTVTDKGWEHGGSSRPARPASVTEGDRPETRYLPGGNHTEKVPARPTWTLT